jgi:hypothetical protein
MRFGASADPGDLPEWFVSGLRAVTGKELSDVRTDLPYLSRLRETLPDESRDVTLYHVPSSWCANSMVNDKRHIHDKNGTVFAADSRLGVVYATCSSGTHKITENNSKCVKVVDMFCKTNNGIMQSVELVKGKCVHWVMVDEDSMHLLVETGYCYMLGYFSILDC